METLAAQVPLWMNILLGLIVINLLVWPLASRWVESHLEIFLLGVGAAAVTVSGGWSVDFIYETLQYKGTRDQIARIHWIMEKARDPEKHLLQLH